MRRLNLCHKLNNLDMSIRKCRDCGGAGCIYCGYAGKTETLNSTLDHELNKFGNYCARKNIKLRDSNQIAGVVTEYLKEGK